MPPSNLLTAACLWWHQGLFDIDFIHRIYFRYVPFDVNDMTLLWR